jgi:hypothetical protein
MASRTSFLTISSLPSSSFVNEVKNVIGQIPSDTEHNAIHVTFINNMGDVFELAETEIETLRGSEKEVVIVHKEGRLTVSIDNAPCVDVCMNLADPTAGAGPNMSGNLLIAGFTAATGQQGDKQEVLGWIFSDIDPQPYISIAGNPPPCPPIAARQTLAPTTPPPPAPQPKATPAPTPSPLRQARVLITVNATQVLSESFVIAYEQACSLVLTNLPELPETTCEVEQQRVVNSTVVLTVLVEADVPGLDVLVFANLAIAALNDPLFTESLAVIGTQLDAPAFVTVVTLMIDRVQNGRLTPGGIAVFEEACREFFTIRVGNPNFRCQVVPSSIRPVETMPDDNDNGSRRLLLQERQRSLASSSPSMFDTIISAGGGKNPTQSNTQTEFESDIGGQLSTDSSELIGDAKRRADPRDVTDFNDSNNATVMPNNAFTQFLLSVRAILQLLVRVFGR